MLYHSSKPFRLISLIGITLAGVALFLLTAALAYQVEPMQAEETPAPGMQGQGGGGLILPELPADAGQADYGEAAYRLVCSACHAYDGTGLTAEWISTWDPLDQNCWQSKCHALNHPQDGFDLPHYVPPIVGPNELSPYKTAQDLYTYLKATMPYQDPGYLTDEEYWQITAYLIKANGFPLPDEQLSPDTAAAYVIQTDPTQPAPTQVAPTLAPTADVQSPSSQLNTAWIIPAIVFVAAGIYVFWKVRQKGP